MLLKRRPSPSAVADFQSRLRAANVYGGRNQLQTATCSNALSCTVSSDRISFAGSGLLKR